jgi:hypothetical protein
MKAGGWVELFEDVRGLPTMDYPHVHVVHHRDGSVDVVASRADGVHPWRETIPNADGHAVNVAIERARDHIR